jgi:acyl-[acyl-carrier-protein]-phospholipid O-acyltransferase/long-chain-fatty-acid--[acyl-carrier-protein] ligase
VLLAVAVIGLVASLSIDRVPPADPTRHFQWSYWRELTDQWRRIRPDRVLFLAVLGNAYFWFLGMLLHTNIIAYGQQTLALDEAHTAYLLVALAIGIGLGSVAAGKLSGQKIEYGLIPLGSLGLTVFGIILAAPGLSYTWALVDLGLLGFFGGFFVVPINALIQHRPADAHKGGVIAFANLLSFVGTFIASGLALAAGWGHVSAPTVFLLSSVVTLAGTAYTMVLLPEALIRFVLWILTHTLYRVRVVGRDNVPAKGGALFVCNHLSFVDVLLLIASTERPIRFLMHSDFYDIAWLRPWARMISANKV